MTDNAGRPNSDEVASKLEASLADSHANRTEIPTLQEITNVLMAVEDPELHINIVDLGLIYKVDRDAAEGRIGVDMTLTSPACPYGPQLLAQTHAVLSRLPNVKNVKVNTVWTPKWDPRVHASEVAQMLLGLI
jgi:metal-sulfur cluster biosynthetic enzyme